MLPLSGHPPRSPRARIEAAANSTTTTTTTALTEDPTDAATTERDRKRFEGLVGFIATRTRAVGRDFDAGAEVELRKLPVENLQRRADRLKTEIAASAAPPRPVRRRQYGDRPDLNDEEYLA